MIQTYDDLETLIDGPVVNEEDGTRFGGFRATIDYIVNRNTLLRGEVADAAGLIRETINMRCLNEPGRVDKIAAFVGAALRALTAEGQPTNWLVDAIETVKARAVGDAPALEAASIEVVAPQIVSEDPPLPASEPEEDDAEEDTPEEPAPVLEPETGPEPVDWHAYALGLQAQLRAHGIDPVAPGADYVYEITQELAAAAKAASPSKRIAELLGPASAHVGMAPPTEADWADLGRPPAPEPAIQHIDGTTEV